MLQNIGVMQGIATKMDWLNQRHSVISKNVANSDTPGYRPHDLKEPDFAAVIGNVATRTARISATATDEAHIGGKNSAAQTREEKQKRVYEISPDSNSVVLEEQLMKSQTVLMDYQMMTNLYRKNVGMIKTALSQS